MPKDTINEEERRQLQETFFNLESEKLQAEERYKEIFDNALVGLFRIRMEDEKLSDVNREAARIFGYSDRQKFKDAFNRGQVFFPFLQNKPDGMLLTDGKPHTTTVQALHKDGKNIWIEISIRYIKENDSIEGAIKDITDLTETQNKLKEAMEEAKESKQAAEKANEAKTRFLANVSHEIRTPLNSIMGFTEVLMQQIGTPGLAAHLSEIYSESEKLMTLINQLLDLSKIEADKVFLDKSTFQLNHLLEESIRPLMLQIQSKGLDMILNISDKTPLNLYGDSYRLRQILINLITNAVKFTDSGFIRLSVEPEKEQGNQIMLRFKIEDTGIGIPEEKWEHIFSNFEQGENSTEQRYGGTGLGLPIAKKLVNLMNGEMTVNSRPGSGSTFIFTAQFEMSSGEVSEDKPVDTPYSKEISGDIRNSRILICEDYPTNQQIVYHHLDAYGCDISITQNGQEAVDMLRKKDFDLILMDVQMPVMNGLDATRAIRQLERNSDIPIIGMTAAAFQKDRDNCFIAGMNDFIAKPIRRNVLINKIRKWLLPSEETSRPDSLSALPSFDMNEFIREIGIDQQQAEGVVKGFIKQLKQNESLLRKLLDNKEYYTLERELHKTRIRAADIRAQKLESISGRLEDAAHGIEETFLKENFSLFFAACKELEEAINQKIR